MKIEPIRLTPEQECLRGTAKSALYVECYKNIIGQMREKQIRFPRDERGTNDLGINASKFAKWCAFKDRATLYKNTQIRNALPQDIKNIGIDSSQTRSITDKKRDEQLLGQARDINEQGTLIVTLNARIETLEELVIEQDARIHDLELKLAASKQAVDDHMRCHAEQVKNSILSGGRTFDRA
ncbi:hypothetical protein [Vibrio mediterranei]|uniref:hypothetical protein n=1 Tax=Vibrio mediterranei TaxID=689 RepID=UPI00148E43AF|nr:hypothetical protein [Vibrio mediterranei]NOI26921.1 hypothetical protein [Vibrio mediterranei]